MSSFIAAPTSYASNGQPMIPFYVYYSMFGFQRTGDLMWAAGDIRAKGFLMGGTAGRTTLNGEGLQHEDGHSLILASTIPTLITYDPAFAYETAVIVQDGLRKMYAQGEDLFYYLTLYNENYAMPPMREGTEEGILKGLYKFSEGEKNRKLRAHIFGSGTLLRHALTAQKILLDQYGVSADVWSATRKSVCAISVMRGPTRRWRSRSQLPLQGARNQHGLSPQRSASLLWWPCGLSGTPRKRRLAGGRYASISTL